MNLDAKGADDERGLRQTYGDVPVPSDGIWRKLEERSTKRRPFVSHAGEIAATVALAVALIAAGVVTLPRLVQHPNSAPAASQPTAGASNTTAGVTPAQLFDHAPLWPGYAWSFQGKTVGWQVIASSAGPAHCGLESATFLTLGWPPGTASGTSARARQYVRDPRNVLRGYHLLTSLDLHAPLPADARSTGLRYGGVEIYVSPQSLDQAVYVVGGGVTERWPRIDPIGLCE